MLQRVVPRRTNCNGTTSLLLSPGSHCLSRVVFKAPGRRANDSLRLLELRRGGPKALCLKERIHQSEVVHHPRGKHLHGLLRPGVEIVPSVANFTARNARVDSGDTFPGQRLGAGKSMGLSCVSPFVRALAAALAMSPVSTRETPALPNGWGYTPYCMITSLYQTSFW